MKRGRPAYRPPVAIVYGFRLGAREFERRSVTNVWPKGVPAGAHLIWMRLVYK